VLPAREQRCSRGDAKVTSLKPGVRLPPWARSSALSRAIDSLRFLGVHGFLIDSEREKVRRRLQKWVDRGSQLPPDPRAK
jgi:hypothetical protein